MPSRRNQVETAQTTGRIVLIRDNQLVAPVVRAASGTVLPAAPPPWPLVEREGRAISTGSRLGRWRESAHFEAAPPMRPPSTSACENNSRALSALTLPP